jgi:hypothetical protein
MINFLLKINRAYDNIKEPNRLYIMLALCVPGIIVSNIPNIYAQVFGWTYLIILLAIRFTFTTGRMDKWNKG